jgi:predicted permease
VISQDLRYAFRSLRRAPAFTIVVLLTLALGIGGTTAIFSVVDGILLRPLPYPDPNAIVSLIPDQGNGSAFAPADYLDYSRSARSLASMAAYRQQIVDLTGGLEPVRLTALETTVGFFDVFGIPALRGRVYGARTDAPTGPRLALISENVWQQHLGAATDIVGRTIRLNGTATEVIGVLPSSFVHPSKVDLWMLAPADVPTPPIKIDGELLTERQIQFFQAIARIAPGVSLAQANDDLHAIGRRLASQYPDTNEGETVSAQPYQDTLVGSVRSALLVLMGAVAFVLLIACANVASLLLARGAARRRELAVRSAMGAGRGRLIRQLLTESLVLAGAGGVLGLLLATWGVEVLVALAPESIPRLADVGVDPRVTVFAVSASMLVGVIFGIVPAFQGARAEVTDALKDGGRTGTARMGTQNVLVIAQVALALVLLVGAGLMLASFARLRAVDPGFVVRSLIVVGVPLPQARYDNAAQTRFYTQLYERLRENPVTARSALGFPTPFTGGNAQGAYTIEGQPPRSRPERPIAKIGSVSPGYFQTMGIPLIRGRDVALTDTDGSASVALINQTFADREWPGVDPLGRRFSLGDPAAGDSWITVIGVVGNSKHDDLQAGPQPAVYLPLTAFTIPFMGAVVRTDADEATVANAVRAAVRTLDAELPIADIDTLDRILERATGQPRFRAFLVGAFAAAALLLAAVGLYGLISYTVAQRIPEIGVRLALGATPGDVGRLVLRQGLALAAAGVAIGLVGALAATRLLAGLLFSISATDPTVYGAVALLLVTIAALACVVPARRAMRVDPAQGLRH